MPFDLDQFISDCKTAVKQDGPQALVRNIAARAVSDPAAVLKRLGEPTQAGMQRLYHSSDLTIVNVIWAPYMTLLPHNHRMWAVIAMYTGREDNIFWRRTAHGLEAYGANVLFAGHVAALASDAVHSVTNPLTRFTGGIHIYGGDFFATPRSQWDLETLAEEASDGAKIQALFARENERGVLHACPGGSPGNVPR
jgi:predicted metal-dependent enzyme (double-stranded beta helix superfamily)